MGAHHLTKNGYKTRLVAGGFDSWKDAGGATVANQKQASITQ
jgi:rhodanese-related sulfurtransferase